MRHMKWKSRLWGGLLLLSAAGCTGPSYSPYGGGYPGGYGNPSQPMMAPQAVPGTYSPQVPGYMGTSPQWTPGTVSPQPAPGNAPLFNPSSAGRPIVPNENPVPEYQDPSAFQEPAQQPQSNGAVTPFSFRSDSDAGFQSAQQRSFATTAGGDPFEVPVPTKAAGSPRMFPVTEANYVQPNPYDYDRKNYRWLRGVVDYDEEDRTWNIIYGMNPNPKDEFGGSITLVNDNRFQILKTGDVVYLEGRVDSNAIDLTGKPRYRVDHLAPLVPKK